MTAQALIGTNISIHRFEHPAPVSNVADSFVVFYPFCCFCTNFILDFIYLFCFSPNELPYHALQMAILYLKKKKTENLIKKRAFGHSLLKIKISNLKKKFLDNFWWRNKFVLKSFATKKESIFSPESNNNATWNKLLIWLFIIANLLRCHRNDNNENYMRSEIQ